MFIEYVPGEKHAPKNAERSESMDPFTDCGQLLTDQDIVIDIDHLPKESIKALIKDFNIKTQVVWTERGAHLWFSKPLWFKKRSNGVCRLGFEIEQHNQNGNPNGMTVKRNGKERQIDNFGVRQPLPKIFSIDKKGSYHDLTGLQEGEGRNNKLYAHRRALLNNNAADDTAIISFINYHVFGEPLEASELNYILREEVETDDKDSKYAYIVNQIMNEGRVVKYSGSLWWYTPEGEYQTDPKNERLKRRIYAMCENETTRFVDEVIKQIEYKSPLIPPETVFPVRFKNGILTKGEFIPMTDFREFTPYFIDIDYKPDADPDEKVDEYIDNLTGGDEDYKKLLMEVIGYVLITDPEKIRSLGKFFMFRGDGANGKGTLLEIMRRIYNPKNCTNLSIKQLVDERYKVTMVGKLANLGDDIEAEAINNDQLKVIKNISTADAVTTRHMYSESETTIFITKLYFTTNSDIHSFEKGYAYKRRVLWMPMFNKVDKPDEAFITKMTTQHALEYWISLIVQGYMRLFKNGKWSPCKVVKDYNDQYHEGNNIALQFAKDLDPDNEIIGKTISDMREDFFRWDTEGRKFSPKLFKAATWDLYRIGVGKSKINGKTARVFMKQSDTTQTLDH